MSKSALKQYLVSLAAGVLALQGAAAAEDTVQTARGVVRAKAEATINGELGVAIESLPFREGESFREGDVLITFDCGRLRAEVAAANAAARADELVFSNNRRLLARGAIGAAEARVSQARFDKSHSEAVAMAERARPCEFRAPFNGKIVERLAQEHESPPPNQPVLRIVDATTLEIEAIVPSNWLAWLKPGAAFSFAIEETGGNAHGEVTRLGATVDPVSQTVKIHGTLKGNLISVLPGMSGRAAFAHPGS
jgi:membrane fusion protein (multidrug efflux system)